MAVYLVILKQCAEDTAQGIVHETLDRYTHTWLSKDCVAVASHKDLDSLWIEFSPALDDGCESLHVMALDGRWKGDGGGSSDQWLGIHLDGLD